MTDLVLAGGTVVTEDASFRADVAINGERVSAIGIDLPSDGAGADSRRSQVARPAGTRSPHETLPWIRSSRITGRVRVTGR